MFRDDRDALSAQVEALGQQLREAQRQLEEARQPKVKRPWVPWLSASLLIGALFAANAYRASQQPSPPTQDPHPFSLSWRAHVRDAEGQYPKAETPCEVVLDLKRAPGQEPEGERWLIRCGAPPGVLTVNEQSFQVRYLAEEEGAYQVKARLDFERASDFTVDTFARIARLSRPGYGFLELTLDGPAQLELPPYANDH